MSRSQRNEAYAAFALAYDQALGIRFAAAAQTFLASLLSRYPAAGTRHLDVACGTGLTLRYFEQQGWDSIGVDASIMMLGLARSRAARLACGDFRALPFRGSFDLVTCLYDSLNHLKTREDLASAFRSVASLMHDRSWFLFDMNHPDVYQSVWSLRQPFVSSGDQHHLEIATTYRKADRRAYAIVTGWAKTRSGTKISISEPHEQRAYERSEIVDALTAAGLDAVEILDFDPYNEQPSDGPKVKLFFVCRRARSAP